MDDVIFCLHHLKLIMDTLDLSYDMKELLLELPKIYLGAEIKKYQVRSGKYHWIMLNIQYVKNEIETLELMLKDEDR